MADTKFDGIQSVVELLTAMDEAGREKLLANLAKRDPGLVQELQKRLFVFEDLIRLDAKLIQEVLREVPQRRLALALRKASASLKAFIFGNLSARAAALLQEEIDALGPRRVTEVEAAQQQIVEIAKKAFRG